MQSLIWNKSAVPLSLESAWLDKHILREYSEVTDLVDLPFGVDSSLSETTANWQMAFTPDLGISFHSEHLVGSQGYRERMSASML